MNAPFVRELEDRPGKLTYQRWASFGPYYAMFPVSFARRVVTTYTEAGDSVLDPFSGRGTSIICAAEFGREGLGVELNPLGWLYGDVKLNPGRKELVLARLAHITNMASEFEYDADQLPEFFKRCFCKTVREFLVASREALDWRGSRIDRTLMGFILVYLHGKVDRGRPNALSNQMRQTKAMAPEYSIRWWAKNSMYDPPEISPEPFLRQRVEWRYAKGKPANPHIAASIRNGDCRKVLPGIRGNLVGNCKLLLTSPPYCGVTSYYYDQWLRFWMLGETSHPTRDASWKGKFENGADYQDMLDQAFASSRRLLADDATIYVRTDKREATKTATLTALEQAFPEWSVAMIDSPFPRDTQTALFGDRTKKPGEVDIVMRR